MRKDPVLVEIGSRLQKLRRQKGISQEALANLAGLHRTYLGMVERGERNVTVVNLLRITTAIDVSPGAVLEGLTVNPKPER